MLALVIFFIFSYTSASYQHLPWLPDCWSSGNLNVSALAPLGEAVSSSHSRLKLKISNWQPPKVFHIAWTPSRIESNSMRQHCIHLLNGEINRAHLSTAAEGHLNCLTNLPKLNLYPAKSWVFLYQSQKPIESINQPPPKVLQIVLHTFSNCKNPLS